MSDRNGSPLKPGDTVLIRHGDDAVQATVLDQLADNSYRLQFGEPRQRTPADLRSQTWSLPYELGRGPLIVSGDLLEYVGSHDDNVDD